MAFTYRITLTLQDPTVWTAVKYSQTTPAVNLGSVTLSSNSASAFELDPGDVLGFQLNAASGTWRVNVSGFNGLFNSPSTSLDVTSTTWQWKTVQASTDILAGLTAQRQSSPGTNSGTSSVRYFQNYVEPDTVMTVSAPATIIPVVDTSFGVSVTGATVGDVVKIMTVPGNLVAGFLFIGSTSTTITASSNLPPSGGSQGYKLVVYRTDDDNTKYNGSGPTGVQDVVNGAFTVSAPYLITDTSITVGTPPNTIASSATTFPVALSSISSPTIYRVVQTNSSWTTSAEKKRYTTTSGVTSQTLNVPTSGLTPNNTLYYKVEATIAQNVGGTGGWSEIASSRFSITMDAVPTVKTFTSSTPSSINFGNNTVTVSLSGTTSTQYYRLLEVTSAGNWVSGGAIGSESLAPSSLQISNTTTAGNTAYYRAQTRLKSAQGGNDSWYYGQPVDIMSVIRNTTLPDLAIVVTSPSTIAWDATTLTASITGAGIGTSYRLVDQVSGGWVVLATTTASSSSLALTGTANIAYGASEGYIIQGRVIIASGGTGIWENIVSSQFTVTRDFIAPDLSISVPNISVSLTDTSFTAVIVGGGSPPTSYRVVNAGSNSQANPSSWLTVPYDTANFPAGTQTNYNIQGKVTTANGGADTFQPNPSTLATFTVTKENFVLPDVTVTVTAPTTIDDQDQSFSIVISGTGVDTQYRAVGTDSAGSTVVDLGVSSNATTTSLTLTMPAAQSSDPVKATDFPAGDTHYYKIQGQVTVANGGDGLWDETTTSSLLTVYKTYRVPDTTIAVSPTSQNVGFSATSFNINIVETGTVTVDSDWTQYRILINSSGAVIAGATRLGPGVIGVGNVPSSGSSTTYKVQASAPNNNFSKGTGSWSNIVGNTFTVTKNAAAVYGFQHLNSAGTVVVDSTAPTKTVLQIASGVTITLVGGSTPQNSTTLAVAKVSSQQDLEDNYIFERTDAGGIWQIFAGNDLNFDITYASAGYVTFTYNAICTNLTGTRACTSSDSTTNTFDIFVIGKTL